MTLRSRVLSLQSHAVRALRFGIVGIVGTLTYAAVAFPLNMYGMGLITSHLIASAISLVVSYLGQKIYTFRIRGEHRKMGPRFAFATLVIACLHYALVWVMNQFGASDTIALISGILFFPPASYLIHTYWTFARRA